MSPWAICKSPWNIVLLIIIFLLKSKLCHAGATLGNFFKESLELKEYPFPGFQIKALLCQPHGV